jgi:hypothetical protein
MGLTLLRQDDDIRQSDVYADNVAPTEAAYETNPTSLEDDLTNVRSQLYNLLKAQTGGNWWDDLNTPTALDTGTQRGVNDLNTDLHGVERKRTLRYVWNLHSISGGVGVQGVILGSGELPSDLTLAIGSVTTEGTVVATATTFGTFSATDDVSGSSALAPKNLVPIVDAATRDPILDSGGERIYGLLQSESAVDGSTAAIGTPNRVQVSFVKVNGAGTDLELITSGDMNGKTFDFASVERIAWEDRVEQDWLGVPDADVPAGSTVTRQVAYDNQGTTPVNVTTNSFLDLEGAGLSWEIRDDLEATLFKVTEGSAGGTSEVQLAAAVDVFNVDAVDNDFLNGATFGTTGTGIQVAETAGVIERAADLEIRASGSGELYLDDSNQPVSWAQTAGVKLSDTGTEWSDYETAFGGEVSLLNAIVQAYNAGADPVRTYHDFTGSAIAADVDVGGPGTAANNIDVDFPDAFVTAGILNTWVYLNGRLMRPGADSSANNDYYPGTTFTAGDVELKWERAIKPGDVFVSVYWP